MALSEGQVQGIKNFKRGIRLNGTALQDDSGFTFTGATNSTDMVTRASGTWGSVLGRDISGGSIPAGATIIKVVNPTTVQISVPATATASGLTLTVSGANNFKNYRIFFLPGTQAQNYIPGFTDASTLTQVGLDLKHDTPWTIAITNSDADRVRVTVRFPRLQKQNVKNGNIHGTSVELKFELNSGGGYVTVVDDVLTAMSANGYDRTYRIALPQPMPGGGWTLRVTRVTPDSTSEALQNSTQILAYSEVTDAKLRYPNTALFGIEVDTQGFGNNVPTVTFDLEGIIVQVPTNYDPVARTYATTGPGTTAGAWDGTFKLAYTRNPTWQWRDLIVSNRYGLGRLINASYIDKYALYTMSQYCDQLVPDGLGGTEPRFSGDPYIAGQEEAIKLLQNMASVFRALTYYSVGLIVPVQDAPYASIAYQFSPENVIDGKFVYAGSSISGRHTQAVVWWSDKSDNGTLKPELYEDKDAVALYGVNRMEITAFGCTSRGQAHRLGRWSLLTEQLDNDTVTFASGYEAMVLRPGNVIQIQDPFRSGRTLSGRTHSATSSTITLDKPVVIESGKTYQLNTLKTDGTIQTNNVTTGAGTVTTLSISGTFGQTPLAETLWILSVSDLVPELWRVISNIPNDKHQCQIVALKFNASKFAAADDTAPLVFPPTSVLPNPNVCLPPSGLTITELAIIKNDNTVQRALEADWVASPDPFLRDYEVRLRKNNGNWELQPLVTGTSVILNVDADGDYDVQVLAVNRLGARSSAITASYTVDDANPLPGMQISGLELSSRGANKTEFNERDCNVTWRVNSLALARFFWADPMQGTRFDPYFQAFECQIIRLTDNAIIYREEVKVPFFSFTLEKNIKANGGVPLPQFKIKVRVKDTFGNLSAAESMIVNKRAPTELPTNIAASAVMNGITVAWSKPADKSIVKINFYLAANPGLDYPIIGGATFTDGQVVDTFVLSDTANFTAADIGQPIVASFWPAGTIILAANTVFGVRFSAQVSKYANPPNIVGGVFTLPNRVTYKPIPAASVNVESSVKTILGLSNAVHYKLYVESEDYYGLTTHIAACEIGPDSTLGIFPSFLGFQPQIPDDLIIGSIPAVTAEPAPPNAPPTAWNLKLHIPGWADADLLPASKSGKQIFVRLSAGVPTESDILYSGGIALTGSAVVSALGFFNGIAGAAPRTFVYTAAATGVIAPTFTPGAGTYYTSTGTLPVNVATTSLADFIFYTTDGTLPTHTGATPTGTTKRITGNHQAFTLPTGRMTFRALGYKSGWTDSAVVSAVFNINKSNPERSGGGGSGGPLP